MYEASTLNTLVKTQKYGQGKMHSKTFAFKNAYGNNMLQESYETERNQSMMLQMVTNGNPQR